MHGLNFPVQSLFSPLSSVSEMTATIFAGIFTEITRHLVLFLQNTSMIPPALMIP